VVLIPCRRFGTTYFSHLQEESFSLDLMILEDGTSRSSRNVSIESPLLAVVNVPEERISRLRELGRYQWNLPAPAGYWDLRDWHS